MSEFNKIPTSVDSSEEFEHNLDHSFEQAVLDIDAESESRRMHRLETAVHEIMDQESLDAQTPELIQGSFEHGEETIDGAIRFGVDVIAREGDDPFTTAELARHIEPSEDNTEKTAVVRSAFEGQVLGSTEEQRAEIAREFENHYEREERLREVQENIRQGIDRLGYGDDVHSAVETLFENQDSEIAIKAAENINSVLERDELVSTLRFDSREEGIRGSFKNYIVNSSEVSGLGKPGADSNDMELQYLSEDIEGYNNYLSKVIPLHDKAVESGFLKDRIAHETLGVFSRYAINTVQHSSPEGVDGWKSYHQSAAHVSSKNLERYAQIGAGGAQLYENFPNLADRMIVSNGGEFTSDDLLSVAERLDRISQSDSELRDAVMESIQSAKDGGVSEINNLDAANEYLDFAESTLGRDKLVDILADGDESKRVEGVQAIFLSREHDYKIGDQDRGLALDHLVDTINNFELDESTERAVVEQVLYGSSPEWSVDLINSDLMQDHLNGENSELIRENLDLFMKVGVESYEATLGITESSLELLSQIDSPAIREKVLPGLLQAQESLSQRMGGMDLPPEEARELFSEKFMQFGLKADKDGNLYDSPVVIASVLRDSYSRFARQGESPRNPESLEWFSQNSELPISAYETVTTMRHEAAEAGIEDSPDAIYEWTFANPERVAELSKRNLSNYVAERIASRGPREMLDIPEGMESFIEAFKQDPEGNAEALIEFARGVSEARQEHFRSFVNISERSLKSAIEGGMHLKSIFDLDDDLGRGDNYDGTRSGVEVALGIRSMDDETKHPIYGSAGYIDDGVPQGAYGYGEILMTFKQDMYLDARTSYTPQDSFHGANRLTKEDAMTLRVIKDMFGIGHAQTASYIETQTVGGLDINGVENIYVNSEEQRDSIVEALPDELKGKVILQPDRQDHKFNRQVVESAAIKGSPNGYMPGGAGFIPGAANGPIADLERRFNGGSNVAVAQESAPVPSFSSGAGFEFADMGTPAAPVTPPSFGGESLTPPPLPGFGGEEFTPPAFGGEEESSSRMAPPSFPGEGMF